MEGRTVRAMGIDQGLTLAGFALLQLSDTPPVVLETYLEEYKVGRRRLKSIRAKARRLVAITATLCTLWKPDIVVTEMAATPFETHKRGTFSTLAGATFLLFAGVPEPIPIILVNVSSWQSEVLHYKRGQDTKQLSIALVKSLFGLDKPHHICDAINMTVAYPTLEARGDINVLKVEHGGGLWTPQK